MPSEDILTLEQISSVLFQSFLSALAPVLAAQAGGNLSV